MAGRMSVPYSYITLGLYLYDDWIWSRLCDGVSDMGMVVVRLIYVDVWSPWTCRFHQDYVLNVIKSFLKRYIKGFYSVPTYVNFHYSTVTNWQKNKYPTDSDGTTYKFKLIADSIICFSSEK